jgi:hypothetical protein
LSAEGGIRPQPQGDGHRANAPMPQMGMVPPPILTQDTGDGQRPATPPTEAW